MGQQVVEVDGIKTRYVLKGEERNALPVLLVHGWGCSIEVISNLIDELSKSHQVIALDLPGHGQSSLPTSVWGTGDFATFLGKFLETLSIQQCNAIGHSVGGRFLAMLAVEQPERISKLILAGASGIKPRRRPVYYLKVSLAKIGKFAERYLGNLGLNLKKAIYHRIASPDYSSAGELRSSFIKIINEDIREYLSRIKAKTLLLWGEDDLETPVSSARVFAERIPGSQLVVVKNAGHYLFFDQPERFLLEVKRFLR